jgi:hypothetical protein
MIALSRNIVHLSQIDTKMATKNQQTFKDCWMTKQVRKNFKCEEFRAEADLRHAGIVKILKIIESSKTMTATSKDSCNLAQTIATEKAKLQHFSAVSTAIHPRLLSFVISFSSSSLKLCLSSLPAFRTACI